MSDQIIIGMSGHIDHGKTSIVKSLTGKNTDILSQERERGMTIDIGFAHLSDKITIIDVPGHEKFIKNMVTGISYIDLAILVVAADDGVMPQTKEHFEILKILNIKNGIIVINKIDLADNEWIKLVESDIKELVKGSFLEKSSIFKVSIPNNEGIKELKEELLNINVLKNKKIKNNSNLFRMYIDRSFSQQGFGTIVTGTVISGSIKIGDKINILPINKTVRLRSAQTHHDNVNTLTTGNRAALNLHGIEKSKVERGFHLSNQDSFKAINQFLASISTLTTSETSLRQNERLRFHIGTNEIIGRISICKENHITPGKNSICLVKLEKPVVISFQDQFLIRTYSPMRTIGGGVVEDINCLGKWKELKKYAIQLIGNKNIEHKMEFIIENQFGSPFRVDDIVSRFGFSLDRVIKYLDLNKHYKIINYLNEKWIITENQLNKCFDKILKQVKYFHKENPYRMGVLKKELYQKLKINEMFFDFCIDELINESKLTREKELISLKSFKLNLSDDELLIMEKIIQILNKQGFCSQNYIELANFLNMSPDKVKLLINIAEKNQKIIRLNEELLFTSQNFNKLVQEIRSFFNKNNKLTVADFKNIANTTRKYAVPILEYFDKKNITYREGNYRKLV